MDAWVRVTQEAGLHQVAMISPWPATSTREATPRFVIARPESYLAYVSAVVERYDGDGIDDMPGLKWPIDQWEIDSGPDLKNLVDAPTGKADDFATPAQVAEVVRLSARAIRSAHPEATVIGGGFHSVTTDHGHAYMKALFAEKGVLAALDVVSVQVHHEGPGLDAVERTLDRVIAAAPGMRVRVTETSVTGAPDLSGNSEVRQARLVIPTWLTCLSRGVEQVYWSTLFDSAGAGPPGSALYARMGDGGLRARPAASAFRSLAVLLGGTSTDRIEEVPFRGGRSWKVGESVVTWVDNGPVLLLESTGATRNLTP